MATKISTQLIGGTDRMKNPAQQGAGWSCNCFPEHNGNNYYQASLPGLEHIADLPIYGDVRGCYTPSVGQDASNDLFVAVGSKLIRVYGNNQSQIIGTINNTTPRVSFAETGGERALLLIADGTNLWYYNLKQGGSLVQIPLPFRINSDSQRITPSHVAVVGGSIVVNDVGSGYVYYSIAYPLNSDTRTMFKVNAAGEIVYDGLKPETDTYPSVDNVFYDDYHVQQYFNGESASDAVTGLIALGSALYLFGPKTVEIWQRGTGEYQTWQRTSYTINGANGLDATYSIAQSGDTLFYIGSGESYGKAVMSIKGTSFTKVSEDWLDDKLIGEDSTTAYGFSYSVGGHNFYVLQLTSTRETWVYDATEKAWHERRSLFVNGSETPWRCQAIAWWKGTFYAFCNDGGIYEHSTDYYAEDYTANNFIDDEPITPTSMPITRYRQTSVIVDEYRPFILEELSVECNTGTWGNAYDVEDPKVTLAISDDGGNTFQNYDYELAGLSGEYSHRVRFIGLGLNRLCVIRISFSYKCDFVMTAMGMRTRATMAVI